MRRELTAEQKAARDARRAKFKALWRQVAKMSDDQKRAALDAAGVIFTTCEGHALSLANCMLVCLQLPGASVLGGFRQWLKHGRAVKKGEHGAMIWCPTGKRANTETGETASGQTEPTADEPDSTRFIVGTVFDILQTSEIEVEQPIAAVSSEVAQAFGMASLPNVRVVDNQGELAEAASGL